MSDDEVATEVDAACVKASGYSVWLPEHLQKTGESIDQARAIIRRANDEFGSSLEALDPPDDLREPLERLATEDPEASASSLGAIRTSLKRRIALLDEVGATRCAKSVEASLLFGDGKSVEDAYRSVGLPLPPRPAGW